MKLFCKTVFTAVFFLTAAALVAGTAASGQDGGLDVTLDSPSEIADGRFGRSVDSSVSGFVISQPGGSNATTEGSVFFYSELDGEPIELKASDGQLGDEFGTSVSINNVGQIAVGSLKGDFRNGSVYVFTPDGLGGFTEEQLSPCDEAACANEFGKQVGIADDGTVVASDPLARLAGGSAQGALHFFTPTGDAAAPYSLETIAPQTVSGYGIQLDMSPAGTVVVRRDRFTIFDSSFDVYERVDGVHTLTAQVPYLELGGGSADLAISANGSFVRSWNPNDGPGTLSIYSPAAQSTEYTVQTIQISSEFSGTHEFPLATDISDSGLIVTSAHRSGDSFFTVYSPNPDGSYDTPDRISAPTLEQFGEVTIRDDRTLLKGESTYNAGRGRAIVSRTNGSSDDDPLNIGGQATQPFELSSFYASSNVLDSCVVDLAGELATPDEVCFSSAADRNAYLASAGLSPSVDTNPDRDFLGLHTRYDDSSLAVIGAACADSVDLRGSRWEGVFSSNAHGCPLISYSTATPGAFSSASWASMGDAGVEKIVTSLQQVAYIQYLPEQLPEPEKRRIDIVIVGDSYSAGNGSRSPLTNAPSFETFGGRDESDCLRGWYTWGRLYEDLLKAEGYVTTLKNAACSDNITRNYAEGRSPSFATLQAAGTPDDRNVGDDDQATPGIQGLGEDLPKISSDLLYKMLITEEQRSAYLETEDRAPLLALAEAEDPNFDAACRATGHDEELRWGDGRFESVAVSVSGPLAINPRAKFYCERSLRPQSESITADTDLILMTYGGNDIFFSSIVKSCLVSDLVAAAADLQGNGLSSNIFTSRTTLCRKQLEDSQLQVAQIEESLFGILNDMRLQSACNAHVVLLAYPSLERDDLFTRSGLFSGTVEIGERLKTLGDDGEAAQQRAVTDANLAAENDPRCGGEPFVTYQDGTRERFDFDGGQEPQAALAGLPSGASRTGWIWAVEEFGKVDFATSAERAKEPYHPKPEGHANMADVIWDNAVDSTFGKGEAALHDVDIAFVVNTGGTMTDEINTLGMNAQRIVDQYEADSNTARLALVTYGINGATVQSGFDPFRRNDDFVAAVEGLTPDAPGPPVQIGLQGLRTAVDGLDWRPGVKKVVVLITDTPSNQIEPETGETPQTLSDALWALDPAELYAILTGEADEFQVEAEIAAASGGLIVAVAPGDIANTLEVLSSELKARPFAWAGDGYLGVTGEPLELDGSASFDTDGELVSYEWDLDQDGMFEIGPLATPAYVTAFDNEGSLELALRVTDDDGNTHIGTAKATILDSAVVNAPPTIGLVDDTGQLESGSATIVDVLGNDSGEIDAQSLELSQPLFGTVGVVQGADGTTQIEYTLNEDALNAVTEDYSNDPAAFEAVKAFLDEREAAGEPGDYDGFDYLVCGDDGKCDTANVIIELGSSVLRVPPTVASDEVEIAAGSVTIIDVLANDSDSDGQLDPDSLAIKTDGSLGSSAIVAGQISYTAGSQTGTDEITYVVCDLDRKCTTGTLSIIVTSAGAAPIAMDDIETTLLDDGVIEIDVLANDTDSDGDLDPSSLVIINSPNIGTATVNTSESVILYTPTVAGTATLVYEVCDERDNCSQATVVIDILGSSDCTITGTSGNDVLTGTDGDDVICGLGGDDIIRGKKGHDILIGGHGNDTIYGGAGADVVIGGRGSDELYGGSGHDLLQGRRGGDILHGNGGRDLLRGGRGNDKLYGGDGQDILRGGPNADELYGQNGGDVLRGRRGNDTLDGGTGKDTLIGGRGNDTANGRGGFDLCHAETTRRCEGTLWTW